MRRIVEKLQISIDTGIYIQQTADGFRNLVNCVRGFIIQRVAIAVSEEIEGFLDGFGGRPRFTCGSTYVNIDIDIADQILHRVEPNVQRTVTETETHVEAQVGITVPSGTAQEAIGNSTQRTVQTVAQTIAQAVTQHIVQGTRRTVEHFADDISDRTGNIGDIDALDEAVHRIQHAVDRIRTDDFTDRVRNLVDGILDYIIDGSRNIIYRFRGGLDCVTDIAASHVIHDIVDSVGNIHVFYIYAIRHVVHARHIATGVGLFGFGRPETFEIERETTPAAATANGVDAATRRRCRRDDSGRRLGGVRLRALNVACIGTLLTVTGVEIFLSAFHLKGRSALRAGASLSRVVLSRRIVTAGQVADIVRFLRIECGISRDLLKNGNMIEVAGPADAFGKAVQVIGIEVFRLEPHQGRAVLADELIHLVADQVTAPLLAFGLRCCLLCHFSVSLTGWAASAALQPSKPPASGGTWG